MKRLMCIIVLALVLTGCGDATEVGNPTGVPRTITGTLDESTIDVTASYEAELDLMENTDAAINLADLNVVATPTDGTPDIIAPVEEDGFFTIDVIVGRIYTFEVRSNWQLIGRFSFEEDDRGNRGDYLVIRSAGDPIDLGTVRYQGGEFRPENEPRHNM
jgi:hypothetical protein